MGFDDVFATIDPSVVTAVTVVVDVVSDDIDVKILMVEVDVGTVDEYGNVEEELVLSEFVDDINGRASPQL